MCQAFVRRQARAADARAWIVAHLMVASGHMRKGTRVDQLMRELLGRKPGTVPGQPEIGAPREMTADQGIQALLAMGAKDRRPESARG